MEGGLDELIAACTNFYNAKKLQEQADAAGDESRNALRQGLELLRDGAIGAPALTAELLLAHALQRDRIYLLTHPEYELSELECCTTGVICTSD